MSVQPRLGEPDPRPEFDDYRQTGEPMVDYVHRILARMREKLGVR